MSKLKQLSEHPASQAKREIQRLLREIVIKRDGGCVLRRLRHCGGEIGQAVLQADHLITRGNSATFSDSRLVVCACKSCHGGFKKWNKEQYDSIIRSILPKERVELWERCLRESWRPVKMDWSKELVGLNQELKKYGEDKK